VDRSEDAAGGGYFYPESGLLGEALVRINIGL
jgi:hypothetical protein